MEQRFETFTVLINRISRNIRKIKNQEMAEYQLRSAHVSCLYYLYVSDGLTSTELCECCKEDKATISRALDYLEKNGYLACTAKTSKRYKSRIVLTEKGIEVGKKIADKIDALLQEIGNGMTERERAEFYRLLSMISDDINSVSGKYEK